MEVDYKGLLEELGEHGDEEGAVHVLEMGYLMNGEDLHR